MNRFRLSALFIFSITNFLGAQVPPSIAWQKSLGGSIGETAQSVQQIADGNLIVAGYAWSSNGDVTNNHGISDYWIVKMDTAGNVLWQKCLGGTNNDVAYSIQQTTDGGFIVAGYSRSSDDDVASNKGLTDYCIMKLDASGNLEWEKSLGGSDDEWAYAVQQTNDGGYIIAGHSKSADGDVAVNHGGWDYWIVRLDASGNLLWQKSLGGSDDDEAYAVLQTSDGGFIVAGGTDSNDGDASGNHGSGDDWLVKLSEAGDLVWQKCLGGSGDDYAYAIQQTSDGNFIIAGSSTSNDYDVTHNNGQTDDWVIKVDATGNLIWQKSFGGSDYDVANAIQQTIDGGFIVAGNTYSTDGDVTENHGIDDCWILKLDGAGNLLWQKSLGGSNFDEANSIVQNADGSFIIAGLSFSNDGDVSGNHANAIGTSQDYWIIKLNSDIQSGIASLPDNFISLNPNPVHDLLNINMTPYAGEVSIRVMDLEGRVIKLPGTAYQLQTANSIQLNTTSLSEGFYTLQLISKKNSESKVVKFVKE